MQSYLFTLRFRFRAVDDIEARKHAEHLRDTIAPDELIHDGPGDFESMEIKAQRLNPGQPPTDLGLEAPK